MLIVIFSYFFLLFPDPPKKPSDATVFPGKNPKNTHKFPSWIPHLLAEGVVRRSAFSSDLSFAIWDPKDPKAEITLPELI